MKAIGPGLYGARRRSFIPHLQPQGQGMALPLLLLAPLLQALQNPGASVHLRTVPVYGRQQPQVRRAPAHPPLLAGHQQSSVPGDSRACLSARAPSLQPASLLIYKLILPEADL